MLEQHSRTRILTVFEKPAFLPCYVAPEKKAGISNAVRNRVLESYSNISFPLVCSNSIMPFWKPQGLC